MVIIWLMIVTNNLVGVEPTPLKNDGVRQLGLLFPIDGKIKNVPNHQPVMYVCIYIYCNYTSYHGDVYHNV